MNGQELLVRVRNLEKTFGRGRTEVHAVSGVDLDVSPGEIVLIMGPSGSGKTTLLSMLGGLLRPTSGTVEIAGVELTSLAERALPPVRRSLVGFVFQGFNLLEAINARENVEVVLNIAGVRGAHARARAEELLSQFGLQDRMDFRARDLSGGEKQRVSLARALANQPRVILADEPTANLDSKQGREVMRILRGISHEGGRAVVVVSHDQRLREVADRVLWLEDGKFAALARLVVDPICGMSTEARDELSADHAGRRYYFCSSGCRAEFLDGPDAPVGPARADPPSGGSPASAI
jgi:putative ABC transport system ATP-binding protein